MLLSAYLRIALSAQLAILALSPLARAAVDIDADLDVPVSAEDKAPAESQIIPPAPVLQEEISKEEEPPAARFRDIGGSISANFPHPVFLDFEKRFGPSLSTAIGLGGINLKFPMGQIPLQAGIAAIDVRARWHPFDGAFFLGGIFGFQKINASGGATIVVTDVATVNTTLAGEVRSAYFTPHLGWLWVFRTGFTLGFEVGYQLPFGSRSDFSITTDQPVANSALDQIKSTPEYQHLDSQVKRAFDMFGNIPLPYVTALRLGWMF